MWPHSLHTDGLLPRTDDKPCFCSRVLRPCHGGAKIWKWFEMAGFFFTQVTVTSIEAPLMIRRYHMVEAKRRSWIAPLSCLVTTILDKMDEKLRPPLPPFQWWKKWRVFVVARVHHWIGGRGASISHFILSKIVRGPHWRYQKLCILCRS